MTVRKTHLTLPHSQRRGPVLVEVGNMHIKFALSVCGVALALGAPQARADGLTPGGTIIGVFSDPIYTGFVTHDPNISSSTYYDNTATAPLSLSIVNSTDPTLAGTPALQATGSKLQWGSDASVDPSEQFSELIFFGAQIPANIHQPFQAGVITFLNGTSDLTSLIFGASLSLYDNVVSPESYLGTDTVIITTTSNLDADATQDADYINICGNGSNICGKSIQADEDSEGGTGVTADLQAQIVGDPDLQFLDVSLAPVQTNLLDPGSPTGLTGGIGDQAAGGVVPEPSTWAMIILGFAGMGVMGYRSKRARAAIAA
ncbi:MAG: PEP-CTERM sorting domain-containing protein [Hyphomicrobiales bacterium]|nr:PEP-CTERM sorting domain-containing protein [Hyphomicrobiales bacterium]